MISYWGNRRLQTHFIPLVKRTVRTLSVTERTFALAGKDDRVLASPHQSNAAFIQRAHADAIARLCSVQADVPKQVGCLAKTAPILNDSKAVGTFRTGSLENRH
jgi:hypothetical protein